MEYINPSFLVKKPSGGFRLVTAFADVGRYSKPQPSLIPDVDSTLRHLGTIQASPHRIATLASCQPPKLVTALRSFIGSYKCFQVSIRQVLSQAILLSDFASRNAPDCNNPSCQICNFIHLQEDSVLRYITTQDVSSVKIKLPFTSRAAWLSIQSECPDIRRTIAHLRQGTRPSKKITNIRDVKRYLNVATLARDSLLVVKKQLPFNPFQILYGLLTSLHIKLEHLSCQQLKNVVSRYFYALDLEKAVELTTNICHQCASLLKTQKVCVEQGSSDQPETVGSAFAVDVLKRERQLILVIRECITSFTFTKLIESERHLDLKDAILQLLTEVHPLDGPFAVIRTDPAPGFNTHVSDQLLARHRLSIELGRVKKPKQNSSCRESDTRT